MSFYRSMVKNTADSHNEKSKYFDEDGVTKKAQYKHLKQSANNWWLHHGVKLEYIAATG